MRYTWNVPPTLFDQSTDCVGHVKLGDSKILSNDFVTRYSRSDLCFPLQDGPLLCGKLSVLDAANWAPAPKNRHKS